MTPLRLNTRRKTIAAMMMNPPAKRIKALIGNPAPTRIPKIAKDSGTKPLETTATSAITRPIMFFSEFYCMRVISRTLMDELMRPMPAIRVSDELSSQFRVDLGLVTFNHVPMQLVEDVKLVQFARSGIPTGLSLRYSGFRLAKLVT